MNTIGASAWAQSRRDFLTRTTLAAAALAAGGPSSLLAGGSPSARAATLPWYRRALRWGQTNITEIDPTRYDIAWWRQHWKRTDTQGVIINAGGIVAYYPSHVPLHLKMPADSRVRTARLLVSGRRVRLASDRGWKRLEIPSVLEHEVVVLL